MLSSLRSRIRSESGQTTSEYVTVTAVGVAIAFGVGFAVFEGLLMGVISTLGDAISSILP